MTRNDFICTVVNHAAHQILTSGGYVLPDVELQVAADEIRRMATCEYDPPPKGPVRDFNQDRILYSLDADGEPLDDEPAQQPIPEQF